MVKIQEKKSIIEEVDLIEDREYILQKLEEADREYENGAEFYTLGEVYENLMLKIDNFKKEYDGI